MIDRRVRRFRRYRLIGNNLASSNGGRQWTCTAVPTEPRLENDDTEKQFPAVPQTFLAGAILDGLNLMGQYLIVVESC